MILIASSARENFCRSQKSNALQVRFQIIQKNEIEGFIENALNQKNELSKKTICFALERDSG